MKSKTIGVGSVVEFRAKVYRKPFTPYYDEYKGHKFLFVKWHYQKTHVELACIDKPAIKVQGYVHPDQLKLAK